MTIAMKNGARPMFDRSSLGELLSAVSASRTLREIRVSEIDADPNQPRREFTEESLLEIGESIRTDGQLQPVALVEKDDGRFMLVFGERRWRGAQLVGIETLEAIVYDAGIEPAKIRRHQLLENLQREDMTALDTANAIAALVQSEGSAAAAARAIHKSEAQVSKYLAVLRLPPLAAELAGMKATRDVETLTTVAKIERDAPEEAAALVEEAKATGRLQRDRVREVAELVNERLKGKKNAAELFQAGKSPVEPARAQKNDEEKPAQRPAPAPGPQNLRATEMLAISVKLADGSRDAKRFERAKQEHGDAWLYLGGASADARRCWVQFGDATRKRKGDVESRLQEFPCSAVVISMVTKYTAPVERVGEGD